MPGGSEVALPTLNVEDTEGVEVDGDGGGGGQGSRRPSKLTSESPDERSLVVDVAELSAAALQQLEPEVHDTQLAEV